MSLDDILQTTFGLLRDGVEDRRSPWRTPLLVTVDHDGSPDLRTVILRAFNPATRSLSVHTDTRSSKVTQLQSDPRASLHVWDPGRRLQVRLRGRVSLHAGDEIAREAWTRLSPFGRQLYRIRQNPGALLASPDADQFDEWPENLAFAVFMVVEVVFDRLEALYLTDKGQIRARFDWSGDRLSANWLVP